VHDGDAARGQGCRHANGLLMASSVVERHLAVGSDFVGRSMPLQGAGYRQRTLDAVKGRGVQVPPPTRTGVRFSLHRLEGGPTACQRGEGGAEPKASSCLGDGGNVFDLAEHISGHPPRSVTLVASAVDRLRS